MYPIRFEGRKKWTSFSRTFLTGRQHRLAIHCENLCFLAGVEEPFYGTLALYDVRSRQKLTENMTFDHNDGELFKLFKKGSSIFCMSNRCLVSMGSHHRGSTYLVIRVDKLMSSDIEKDFSKYQKRPQSKKSASELPIKQWEEMGFVRQPFVWASIPLYDESQKIVQGTILVDEFLPIRAPWTDDFIYDQLGSMEPPKVSSFLSPLLLNRY